MFEFTVPMPPSVNNLYKNAGKKRVKTDTYRTWSVEAGYTLNQQVALARMDGKLCQYTSWVEVVLYVHLELPTSRQDVDNRIKPVLDALVKAQVIADDRLVWRVAAEWDPDEPGVRGFVRPHAEAANRMLLAKARRNRLKG